MPVLAGRLFHKSGLFEIKQHQDSLHVLKHLPSETLAYALFAPATFLQEGILQSSDTPLLLMERFYGKDGILKLAVCSPDLRPVLSGDKKEWISTPTISTLILDGNWQLADSGTKGVLSCSYEGTCTKVVLELKEGLPLYLEFQRTR